MKNLIMHVKWNSVTNKSEQKTRKIIAKRKIYSKDAKLSHAKWQVHYNDTNPATNGIKKPINSVMYVHEKSTKNHPAIKKDIKLYCLQRRKTYRCGYFFY